MHASTILAFAMGLVPAVFAESGPFFDYCHSNSLDYSTLLASCTSGQASIDLDGGVGNQGGQLVWYANGGYYQSCGSSVGGNCDLNYANLECDCKGPQGNIRSSIGLDAHLFYNTDTNQLYFNL